MQRGDRGKRHDKKLSWMFRNKRRISRNEQLRGDSENTTNVQIQNKKARIVIRNLPFKVTEDDIKKHYETFGEIEEVNLLHHPNGKLVGCGFVQFKKIEQASRAIFNANQKEFLGRVVSLDWALPKYKFPQSMKGANKELSESKNAEEVDADGESNSTDDKSTSLSKTQMKKRLKKQMKNKKKGKNVQKRARIIVRNLAFDVTDDLLKDHFSKYGNVKEVQILSRSDGKRVGCGFVQFSLVQSAAKAIHHSNLKPLLGRPIIVDWAIPKHKFTTANENNVEDDKTEVIKAEDIETKTEEMDKNGEADVQSIELSDSEEIANAESSDEEKPDHDELDELECEKKELKFSLQDTDDKNIENNRVDNPKRISNDVSEGKTVFLKNVPFSATKEELRSLMEQYGPVFYALICMDHLTDHSKGTAFVKFQHVEDAEKCLSAGTELRLHDQVLDPHRALDRNEMQDKSELKKQRETDSRNLYLVKEGVILAGSTAAVGVSASDMAARLQLEQWKSQMLRNLNMFVSRNRLVVHNLPSSVDDKKLRDIFRNHSGPKALIREARVMRDLRNIESNGIGKSKEYGFVAFTTHGDALKALRSINNNPNIFGPGRRPIVAFSIENRVMVNAKMKRIEKSRERNPLWTGKKLNNDNNESGRAPGSSGENTADRSQRRKRKNASERPAANTRKDIDAQPTKQARLANWDKDVPEKPYSGIASKPGETRMRSKFRLKSQAILHSQKLKEELKKKRPNKKDQIKKSEKEVSRNKKSLQRGVGKQNQDEANFSKLVHNYKSKLMSVPNAKSKWYETK